MIAKPSRMVSNMNKLMTMSSAMPWTDALTMVGQRVGNKEMMVCASSTCGG
jgi:hypothetical protein